jgi:hypothetical protein
MSIKRKIQQAMLRCRRCLKNASGFFSVSGKELCWLAFCFIFLLIINYFLFALQGFSLSYAKTLPDISVLGGVFFIQSRTLPWRSIATILSAAPNSDKM